MTIESSTMTTKKKARAAATPVPRGTSKQQTREALIDAALELFAEEGLDAPSLDAICLRAGYTRGAFYVHFPDRDALVVAVMESLGQTFLSTVFESLAAGDGQPSTDGDGASKSVLAKAAERFVGMVKSGAYPLMLPPDQVTGAAARPKVRPHQLLDACNRSPVVRDRYKSLVEVCIAQSAGLTSTDQQSGAVRPGIDPNEVGALMVAATIGVYTMSELGVAVDPAKIASLLVTLLSREA